jgi:hypothetical protein
MKLISLIKTILCGALLMNAIASGADELVPQTYVAIEAEVRELTLAGVSERVALLSSGDSTPQSEALIAEKNRQAVTRAYRDNNTTAAAHAVYGTRHSAEIEAWLDAHPEWQAYLDSLVVELEELSAQLDALGVGS